jgi:secreted Zn-dependent insulinase-like peptidase
VISKHSLDDMQTWVEASFGPIPNRNRIIPKWTEPVRGLTVPCHARITVNRGVADFLS